MQAAIPVSLLKACDPPALHGPFDGLVSEHLAIVVAAVKLVRLCVVFVGTRL